MGFIDYITLLLTNMAAGLLALGMYMLIGWPRDRHKSWAPVFFIVGLVATVAGLHMALTHPVPSFPGKVNLTWANAAFGELSVLLGVLFLAAAWATAKELDLFPLSLYALVAGVAGIVVGIYIGANGLTKAPAMSAAGFILTGLVGVLMLPTVLLRQWRIVRLALAGASLLAAALWGFTAMMSYWAHLGLMSKVMP